MRKRLAKYSLLLSCLLHVGIFLFLAISWRTTRVVPDALSPPIVPLELVTVSDETTLDNTTTEVSPKKPLETQSLPTPPSPQPEKKEVIAPIKEEKPAPMLPLKKSSKPKPKLAPKKQPEVTIQGLLSKLPNYNKPLPKSAEVHKADAIVQTSTPKPVQRMTISEMDAFRLQVERCWNVPLGAKDIENIIITLHIRLNKNGTLAADPTPSTRGYGGAFETILVRSAVTAVKKCQPFKMPENKYEAWKEIEVTFNPRDMV